MRERKKRKRWEKLVDKYAAKRGINLPLSPDRTNGFVKHEEETAAPAEESFKFVHVPGVFKSDTLIEHFRIFNKYYPRHASAVFKFIKPYVASSALNALRDDDAFSNAFAARTSGDATLSIDDYGVWTKIEAKIRELCPSMLPFVAQIVNIEVAPSSFCNAPPTLPDDGGETMLDAKFAFERTQVIKVVDNDADWKVSACALSDTVLAVGVLDGSIFLFDLMDDEREPARLLTIDLQSNVVSTRLKKLRLFTHRSHINKIIHVDREEFCSCDSSGSISFWNALSGTVVQTFPVRLSSCLDIDACVEYNNDVVASTSADRNNGDGGRIISFLAGHDDCASRLFHVGGRGYKRLLAHEFPVKKVVLKSLMAATLTCEENAIRLWDLNTGQPLRAMEPLDGVCVSLCLPNADRLYAISESGMVFEVDVASATTLCSEQLPLASGTKSGAAEYVTIMQAFDAQTLICGTVRKNLFAVKLRRNGCGKILNERVHIKELNKSDKHFRICCCRRSSDEKFVVVIV